MGIISQLVVLKISRGKGITLVFTFIHFLSLELNIAIAGE